jgi:hypothetical protein
MSGLPDRPDLDQLRRQARELLRAAVSGDPAAVARIRVVSQRMTLSAAQQALAREYGCRNWVALRAEVKRRRSPLERWSFGGAAAIEARAGTLLFEGLVVGANDAVLFCTLTPWASDAWPAGEASVDYPRSIDDELRALEPSTQTGDITVIDDQGATYALRLRHASGARGSLSRSISFGVDPVPRRAIERIELHGRNGTMARLLPSPRAIVRLGRLAPVTATAAERELAQDARSASLDLAGGSDGARHHLDLGITLPTIDGITLKLDSLLSWPGGWSLRVRATPRWWRYRDDGNRKWSPLTIQAEDDCGGSYQCSFAGSAGRDGVEELSLQFRPRFDPLARRLRLTCTGSAEQIPVDLDLHATSLGHGPRG